jgi:hypothetical protein
MESLDTLQINAGYFLPSDWVEANALELAKLRKKLKMILRISFETSEMLRIGLF